MVTLMTMPETAMDHNNGSVFWEDKIGFTGQTRIMEPIPETKEVKFLSYYKFRLGVFPPDASHHAATGFRGNNINHNQQGIQILPGTRIVAGNHALSLA